MLLVPFDRSSIGTEIEMGHRLNCQYLKVTGFLRIIMFSSCTEVQTTEHYIVVLHRLAVGRGLEAVLSIGLLNCG